MNHEFAHALSGKPEAVSKTVHKILSGYIIRDMATLSMLYSINTTLHLHKWRTIAAETDLYWVIEERFSPLISTKYIFYKTKEIAEEHLKEIR
jgi:hypothetical protein